MEVTHVPPYNAEAIPIQFLDGEPFMFVAAQDGVNISGDGYIAENDGTGNTTNPDQFGYNRLQKLFDKANAHGLTGAPYKLDFPTITERRKWATELNRMRSALFTKARASTGGGADAFSDWALVSDQMPITVNPFPNQHLTVAGTGKLRTYSDVDYVCKSSGTAQVRTQMLVECVESSNPGTPQPVAFKVFSIGCHAGQKITDTATKSVFTFRQLFNINVGPVVDLTYTLTGRTDLFQIQSVTRGNVINAGLSFRFRDDTITVTSLVANITALEQITLGISIGGPLGGFSQVTTQSRSLSFYVGNDVSEAQAGSQDGGALVRATDPTGAQFVRMHCDTEKLKLFNTDSSDIVTLALAGGYLRRGIVSTVIAGDTGGLWLARSAPVANYDYESIAGRSEIWKWARHNSFYYGEYLWSNAIRYPTECKTRQIRAPHAIEHSRYIASGRTPTWPQFQDIVVTVPATPEPAATFNLPALRINDTDYNGTTINCQYYKVPLPMLTREMESRVVWFHDNGVPRITDGGTPVQSAPLHLTTEAPVDPFTPPNPGYPSKQDVPGYFGSYNGRYDYAANGTSAQDYFPQARLTNASGSVFWWKDLIESDPRNIEFQPQGMRWRHWFIGPDGAGYALFLLLDSRDVVVSHLPDGTPVYSPIDYWPTNTISHGDYKAAYGRIGNSADGNNSFLGNWAEFNPPIHYFNTGFPATPVPAWTIGRTSGPKFVAGQTLKLTLPLKLARSQLTDYHPWEFTFQDITHVHDFGPLAGYSKADRRSILYDFSIWKSAHKVQVLALDGGVGKLNYWPAIDLRLYTVHQSDVSQFGLVVNPENYPSDFRLRDFTRADEIPFDDFTVADDGTVKLLNRDHAPGEFGCLLAYYQTRKHNDISITVRVGNVKESNQTGDFQEFDRYTFTGQRKTNPYVSVVDSVVTRQKPWIISKLWPICFKNVEGDVACSIATTARTFMVGAESIDGLVATATVQEDSTLRYRATWRGKQRREYLIEKTLRGWGYYTVSGSAATGPGLYGETNGWTFRWFKLDGTELTPVIVGNTLTLTIGGLEIGSQIIIEQLDETLSQEMPCLRGATVIPPQLSVIDYEAIERRMISIEQISCVQNFKVKITGRELYTNPAIGPNISGTAFKYHYNETKRMLDAWIDSH